MTTTHGPTTGRRRLRNALRRAREEAGLTQADVAAAMDWSLSKVIRIEAGDVSLSTNDTRALVNYYQLNDPEQASELIQLARQSRRRAWWSAYRDAVPHHYIAFIGLEAEAAGIDILQTVAIPGILQTERYARTALEAVIPYEIGAADVEPRLAIRMRRQREIFGRPDPPRLRVIIDESALRRRVGDAETMREQLCLLLKRASERLTIQVVTFDSGHFTLMSPFVILTFADPSDPGVAYIEGALLENVVDKPDHVLEYVTAFHRLQERALPPDESLALIERVAAEFG